MHVEYEPIRPGGGALAVVLELVPPGDWLLSSRSLYRRPDVTPPHPEAAELPGRPFVVAIRFTDAANRTWRRDRDGVLTRLQSGGR